MIKIIPIIFNTEEVKAILDGKKTVTRRIIKPKYRSDEYGFQVCTNEARGIKWIEKYDEDEGGFDNPRYVNPPYNIRDILYIKETWCHGSETAELLYNEDLKATDYVYKADKEIDYIAKWKSPVQMPKEVARIFLKVTDVRIERLQDITEGQATKEGVSDPYNYADYSYFNNKCFENLEIHQSAFVALWNSKIKKQDIDEYGWDANPYVWVIEFEMVNKPIE